MDIYIVAFAYIQIFIDIRVNVFDFRQGNIKET